jgi:DNA-binding transcriptional ArsR family regulator
VEKQDPVELYPTRGWTFLTNHARVLLAVARIPDVRVREIAEATGITERYAYRVLRDLDDAGYVDRRRNGRCNVYRVHLDVALGDPFVEQQSLRELRLIGEGESDEMLAALRPRARSDRLFASGRAEHVRRTARKA